MSEQKSLTLNGLTIPNFIFLLLSIGMVGVSIYLTDHYFQTFFPEGLNEGSTFCNISDFFNCDTTTRSIFGSIFGVPTSMFGILIGLIGMITAFTNSAAIEKSTKIFYILNAAGCLILLIYSLVALGSLCPMCSVYYVLSFCALALLLKHSKLEGQFETTTFASFAVVIIIFAGGMKFHISGKVEKASKLSNSYIEQFEALKDYGDPAIESPYKIHMATENFADAPLRISVFSDFQCPYCQRVAEQMPGIVKEFKDKVNIQYLYYPLDSSCNTKMEGSMHPYACQAAYLAACDEEKFVAVHDHIFENQAAITAENLKKWESDFGLSNCFENEQSKAIVQQTMQSGVQYNLRSTPTIIINGRKVEGLIPTVHLVEILKSLLK